MNMRDEFAVWREQWMSAPAVPVQLIQRVERQTARMQTLRTAETVVTIAMGGAVVTGVVVHPVLDQIYWLILAAGTWGFIVALWIVSIRSTRRVWEPAEYTTAAYVSLRVQRLRRELERIALGTAISVLLSAFVLFLVYEGLAHAPASRGVHIAASDVAEFWIVGGLVNVFVILAQIGKRRKTKAELANMTDLHRRLDPTVSKGDSGNTPA